MEGEIKVAPEDAVCDFTQNNWAECLRAVLFKRGGEPGHLLNSLEINQVIADSPRAVNHKFINSAGMLESGGKPVLICSCRLTIVLEGNAD
jgi:hypothetical protein